jgi:hypothetical protein
MESESIGKQLRQLERSIYNLPAARKLNTLSREQRELMIGLRESVSSARVAYDEAISTEDAKETILSIEYGVERLEVVRESILAASQHDLLSAVDVAELSARTEHISDKLKKIISE